MMTLHQALAMLPSARLVGDGNQSFTRVHSDTRTIAPGDLFVALKGEHFDAHEFLAQAKALGAVAALAQHDLEKVSLSGLEVADSKSALGELSGVWRSQFDLPLIAVTGSNGKTTVTQMIAAILHAWCGNRALATKGNFNNDIGLPLTLLRLRPEHRIGVVELGMNHPGEISYLAKLAQPTVALVNNAQREHLEFMATVEAVAKENGSVFGHLSPTGTAVFPADDDHVLLWRKLAGKRPVVTFALSGLADVTAHADWDGKSWQVVANTPAGEIEFSLSIAGRHNVKNALAATACALAAGVPVPEIAKGLASFEPVNGRSRAMQFNYAGRVLTLVDDSYNANPDSMRAAIEVLAELPGPRLLVMGDMGEVGRDGPKFHREAGDYARLRQIDRVFALGEEAKIAARAFGNGATHFSNIEALQAALMNELPNFGSVLVKGSRFTQMERAVKFITAQTEQSKQKKKLKERGDEPHAA
jgi:UDP-N-acetylmuramoyl-tripeptide--D-alanyl-D-alanine ligase